MTTTESARVDRAAIVAALVTVVLWASAFVGIRAAAIDLSPGSIALGRLAIGSIALGILVVVRSWRPVSRRDISLIVASGVIWFAVYNVALNEAERSIDAGTAAMLVNIGPIMIAVLAGLFLGEGFPARLLAGCLVAFAGTIIIGLTTTGNSTGTAGAGDPTAGIVLCLVAALAYASGVTLQKPALRAVPALQVTWIACLTGTIACLPFAPALVGEIGAAAPASVAWVVYLGVFPTGIAFTTWAFALGRTSAGRLGAMTYLVPPVVIVMSFLVLGETPAPLAVLGGALCLGGVAIARSAGWSDRFAFRSRRAASASRD